MLSWGVYHAFGYLVEILVRLGSYFSNSAQLRAKRNITAFALLVFKELKPFEVFYLINLDWLQKFSCVNEMQCLPLNS